jgi:phage tail-like protein
MNFIVSVTDLTDATAAFSQVTGLDATVDVIEFRQGNANSLAPVKIPGLVKHGNVTLRFGYTLDSGFKKWLMECVSDQRGKLPRHNLSIELVDIRENPITQIQTQAGTGSGSRVWILSNAWVTKYTAPELDAKTSDVAIEAVEIAYEELTIPN